MNIIIDTNIFISALIRDGITRDLIINSPFNLIFPEYELEEIKKYEKLILKKSGLSKEDLLDLIRILLKYVRIVRKEDLEDYRNEAREIMEHIDKDDVVFVATALAFDAAIWSDDKHFKKQDQIKVFTTKEIVDLV